MGRGRGKSFYGREYLEDDNVTQDQPVNEVVPVDNSDLAVPADISDLAVPAEASNKPMMSHWMWVVLALFLLFLLMGGLNFLVGN